MKPIEYNYLKLKTGINIDWQRVLPVGGIGVGLVLIVIFLLSFVITLGQNNVDENNMESDGFVETERTEWWNSEYKYYKRLSVQNMEDFDELKGGSWVEYKFDHRELVEDKMSKDDGSDIVIAHKSKDSEFKTLSSFLSDTNTSDTVIGFKVESDIKPFQKDFDYFMYFGSNEIQEKEVHDYVPEITDNEYKIYGSQNVLAPLFIETNRLWILKATDEFEQYSQLKISLSINDSNIKTKEKPEVIINGKAFIPNRLEENEFELILDADDFDPDEYKLIASITNEEKIIKSATERFIVSHPLYVTWTMDWEGYDTSNDTLKQMDEFSKKYNTPITHFWNPRITIAMGEKRREELLDWLKNRMDNNLDSVGLHIHMHFDLVRASGVEKILDRPHWGGRGNGSDVPTSAYEKEDFVKMVEWSFIQFEKMGLPKPNMYRAGGWYADLKMLEALDELGFILDSSGRSEYSLGRDIFVEEEQNDDVDTEYFESEMDQPISSPIVVGNDEEDELPWQHEYKVDGHWKLSSTTRPYQVSKLDQNSSKEPRLNIWQFPNNGADSWRFSGEDLLNRFKENFSGGIQKESQVLTYLSHPHAINVDIPKLEKPYDYIAQYTIEEDRGPVIHTTLDRCYNDFAKN
jgi:hypothetical protein